MTLPGLMQPTPLTLRPIFDRMRTVHADAEVVDPEGRRTYAEIGERVLRLCRVLTEDLGVRPGDRVASFAVNSTRHLELYWAVPLVGAVLHTVNVRLHDEQIADIMDHAGDRVVFVDDDLADQMATLAPSVPSLERTITLGADYEARLDGAAPVRPDALPDVPESAAFGLCYTSGTTGMPKGVLHSHRAMYLHAMGTCMADSIGVREHDRVLPIVPMFHAFAWGLPYAAALTGSELLLHGGDSSSEAIGRLIEHEGATVAAAVPTIWKGLLPLLQRGEVDGSSLRLVVVGGSASPRALIEAYDDIGIDYLQVWGMTETGPLACASRPRRRHRGLSREELLGVRERTGTILPGVEARVVSDDDEVLPLDGTSVGELEVRGPWIASAYFRDESTDRFHDGWLRTGDMAAMEPDGCFRIVDRAKDLVKSGGEWISSVELEGHLLGHPDVADAAVVGVPSKRWDERPVAVVVPADGVVPSLESVRDFLAPRVAKWWLPDAVVPVDEIPKTSVGKLDKKALRTQLAGVELP